MKTINNLERYIKTPNTISKGSLYIGEINIDGLKEDRMRLVRIYLPSNYGQEESFPVIYMMDGKNLFDQYTSFVGEWEFDEVIEQRIQKNKQGYIVVGIDSAKSDLGRVQEMLPSNKSLTQVDDLPVNIEAYGDILLEYIVNELKVAIDKLFKTNKEMTYIGGSSMGGLFSFYAGQKYPNVFKGTLAFSPAFCLYEEDYFKEKLKQLINKEHVVYLLVGDIEYENQFVKLTNYTYEYLKNNHYQNIKYVHDLTGHHNENFWNKYIEDCLVLFEEHHKQYY